MMKIPFFTTILAAALLGGQVFATEGQVYKLSELDKREELAIDAPVATVVIDTVDKSVQSVHCGRNVSLTIDYQELAPLAGREFFELPVTGALNITSSSENVVSQWEKGLSVANGDPITLFSSGEHMIIYGGEYNLQFFGHDVGETVMLGHTRAVFAGVVDYEWELEKNQIALLYTTQNIYLVGKLAEDAPVPEPATGTLSLLALAALAARRRRK